MTFLFEVDDQSLGDLAESLEEFFEAVTQLDPGGTAKVEITLYNDAEEWVWIARAQRLSNGNVSFQLEQLSHPIVKETLN